MSKSSIINKLNRNRVNIDDQRSFKIKEYDPLDLINHRRFDIMAKYIYGWFKKNNINSDWGRRLYEDHIWVFNQYDEDDGSGKKGIAAFYNSFDSTLKSVQQFGFKEDESVIPISINKVPLDGAHRLTAALLYNQKVKAVKINMDDVDYNYRFFQERGLLKKWSDAMAMEYCKLKKNTHIFITFNFSGGIKKTFLNYGSIFYEKKIKLNRLGLQNLLGIELFDEKWSEVLRKLFNKDEQNYYLDVFVLEQSGKKFPQLTENLMCQMIYMSKRHEQTIKLAQNLLNENSIHYLNTARIINNNKFKMLLSEFKKNIGTDNDNYCLVSNAVMAAYGIGCCEELSCIRFNRKPNSIKNAVLVTYDKGDDVIYNPENHFYYDGIKFATLNVVKAMKQKSKNLQNWRYIRAINKFNRKHPNYDVRIVVYRFKKQMTITRIKASSIKQRLIQLLTKR
ncbi:hypothetical protein [Bacillus niameyensis]|uniref:hypothetical protein n=1 Tax=Bacillus niameyensis TaxID=1522308 RepID=UPI000783AE21|nr:hypothetical protein [Bacillus niameyensis]